MKQAVLSDHIFKFSCETGKDDEIGHGMRFGKWLLTRPTLYKQICSSIIDGRDLRHQPVIRAFSPGKFFEFYPVQWMSIVGQNLIIRDRHEIARIFDIDSLVANYDGTPLVLDERLQSGCILPTDLFGEEENARLSVCYAYPSKDEEVLNLIAYDNVSFTRLFHIVMRRTANRSYKTMFVRELRGVHSVLNDNFFDAQSQDDLAILFLRHNHKFLVISDKLNGGFACIDVKPFTGGVSVAPSANTDDLVVFHFKVDKTTDGDIQTIMNAFVISLEAFLRLAASAITHIDLFDLGKLARMKFHYAFLQPISEHSECFWFSQCFNYLMSLKINQGQFLLWLLEDRMQILVRTYLNSKQAIYHLVSFLTDGSVDVTDLAFAAATQLL